MWSSALCYDNYALALCSSFLWKMLTLIQKRCFAWRRCHRCCDFAKLTRWNRLDWRKCWSQGVGYLVSLEDRVWSRGYTQMFIQKQKNDLWIVRLASDKWGALAEVVGEKNTTRGGTSSAPWTAQLSQRNETQSRRLEKNEMELETEQKRYVCRHSERSKKSKQRNATSSKV